MARATCIFAAGVASVLSACAATSQMVKVPSTFTADLESLLGADCEGDDACSDEQEQSSLSLRQLRFERRSVEAREDSAEDVASNSSSDTSTDELCVAASEYCGDIMTYLLREDCATDRLCRVIDMNDYFHWVPKGEAWYCAPADKKCDRHLSQVDFQPADEVPEQYMSLLPGLLDVSSKYSCKARLCGIFDPNAECQCNTHCKEYGNCCSDYEERCESCSQSRCGFYDSGAACQCNEHCSNYGNCCANYNAVCDAEGNDGSGTCEGRSCFMYVKHATCQCNELCEHHNNCCHDYKKVCNPVIGEGDQWSSPGIGVGGQTMTLYHTTSVEVARLIVKGGFRPGRSGWCDGAIYFINYPLLPDTKYAPGITKDGAILEAKVEMGHMAPGFNSKCQGYGGHGVSAAKNAGYHSIKFNPGDGDEYIIWNPRQVLSVRIYEAKLTP